MDDKNKAQDLRDAFASFMTGVTVVTTSTSDGDPVGFTANSFSSVSLQPALLLVSIAKSSGNYQTFVAATHFAINILAQNQKAISNTFARPGVDRFAGLGWRMSTGNNPVLDGVSAWFDCTMHNVVDAGDHAILIGKVEYFGSAGYAGLGYYRSAYFTPAKIATEVIAAPRVIINTIISHGNKILLIKSPAKGWTLPSLEIGKEGADKTIGKIFGQYQPQASASFVYSVYNNTDSQYQYLTFLCNTPSGQPLSGKYFDLQAIPALEIEDKALASMLDRYRRENQRKSYGFYYGNHNSGVVREIFKKES